MWSLKKSHANGVSWMLQVDKDRETLVKFNCNMILLRVSMLGTKTVVFLTPNNKLLSDKIRSCTRFLLVHSVDPNNSAPLPKGISHSSLILVQCHLHVNNRF